jgi:hypothetical protein
VASRLHKPTSGGPVGDLAARLGVPFAVLLLVFSQLMPRIDRQTEIAERTSAYLGVLVNRAPCGP